MNMREVVSPYSVRTRSTSAARKPTSSAPLEVVLSARQSTQPGLPLGSLAGSPPG